MNPKSRDERRSSMYALDNVERASHARTDQRRQDVAEDDSLRDGRVGAFVCV